ncbi:MAG TPA: hypothetical protein VJP79_02795 [Nitrososphaera sp.]|nr:hypothetical protein [Nitrososphaera sp.]
MANFDTTGNRKKLLLSMLSLAGIVGASVLLTTLVTSYFRGQDPVNQCITDPLEQPYQISVPITVFQDGVPSTVRDAGITPDCTRPVHTLQDNVIHVGYNRPYDFTLGHFFYYWLGDDISHYDVRVFVNENPYTGDFRDIILRQGDTIRIELTSRE